MKRYTVLLPISGAILVVVDAEDEASAIKEALDAPYTIDDVETWEAHAKIVEGNCCHAVQWDAEIIDECELDESGNLIME